ncbi:mediator of RNA polymerase 2 transcription subunit 4 [Sporothrix brasiliensis 5110]|uniref:Mediator of RNA polymerase II transcription subunit 4 n=1 Tax=Sporothrix brasiliensis 5110 TaxID=1398154 RepID=A0A0C2IH69_9PEZI|nr:mediator of RNA polymerase 2 transcription subunit 4 [Sporothrix brasiliensis 5110]KIH86375.1 mediator of RNA polymerase 2 transcription subunit 4 [Sporothrix brasiliensis 5110]
MDKFIDVRFDRVEKALVTLIDSIAKYNPSPALAEDLLAADRELNSGLEQLQTHQNNYLRILALRDDVAALDGQIKSTLLALAASRRDILQTPATEFPEDSVNRTIRDETKHYPFTYDELMSYARRISRNTVPGPGQTDGSEFFAQFGGPIPAPGAGDGGSAPETAAPTPAAALTPGAIPAGPASAGVNGAVGTPVGGGGAPASQSGTPGGAGGTGPGTGTGTAAPTPAPFASSGGAPPPATNVPNVLPDDLKNYIAPTAGTVFSPWPAPDLMMHGGLRALHAATESACRDKHIALPHLQEPPSKTQTQAQTQAQPSAPPPLRIRFVSLEEQEEQERLRAQREAEEREEREERQRQMEEAAAAAGVGAGAHASSNMGGSYGHAPAAAPAPAQFASTLDMEDDD